MVRRPAQQLHVRVRHEDGSFWATIGEFPGVFATGDNLDELLESLQEGLALVRDVRGPGERVPYLLELDASPEV